MKINIKAKSLEMTEAIKNYVDEKIGVLEKYLGKAGSKLINCDVEVERVVNGQNKGDLFRTEVNMQVPHGLLRVEKTENDLYKAINKVRDHLQDVIIKYREKARDKRRRK